MSSIRFDPWVDKTPFGAVPNQKIVSFQIHVSSDVGAKRVELVIREDHSSASKIYDMSFASHDASQLMDSYCVSVQMNYIGLSFYRFEIHRDQDVLYVGHENYETQVGSWLNEWQITVYDPAFTTPDKYKGGVMYQIFPDRFKRSQAYHPPQILPTRIHVEDWYSIPDSPTVNQNYRGNDFYMGNLAGIKEQLPYLEDLKISILYLNPIFESAENHRYSTGDYRKIDPYLGSNQDFEEFVQKCKEKKINVILDGVFSHTGADSLYFNKYNHYDSVGAYNSKDSPYYPWYSFSHYPDQYASWWNFENLPNTNETEPSFLSFITNSQDGVLPFWQRKGTSGWRLDVADELPDSFLDAVRNSVKKADPEALVIGEVWEDASNKESYGHRRRYLLGDQLDSVMNYPWRRSIIKFVQSQNAPLFYKEIQEILENYPSCVVDILMNILSTHDTLRILNVLALNHTVEKKDQPYYKLTTQEYTQGKDLIRFAVFLQFTLPGIPCIYYGDEVGMTGFADPFCRMGYPYGKEDQEILQFYQSVTKIRHAYQDQFKTGFQWIYAGESAIAYRRNHLFCAVNMGEKPCYIPYNKCGKWIFGDSSTVCTHLGTILAPHSFCILDLREEP